MRISRICFSFICFVLTFSAHAAGNSVDFDRWFCDRTLRVNYVFSGDAKTQRLALDELCSLEGWAGRRAHLDSLAVRGNGTVTMQDAATGETIYCTFFSTLFQEWQTTEEATRLTRSFENVFQLPMPRDSVRLTVRLYDFKGGVSSELVHVVNPKDILIRPIVPAQLPPHRYVRRSNRADAIDVAIVAEGYRAEEAELFYKYAEETVEALLAHAPFGQYADCFNFLAVALPSAQSGVSIPGKGEWKHTALSSRFDTFYSARYLTTLRLRQLHDALAGLPYEHLILLANTDNYGGGGILNSYTLTTTGHTAFRPVVVHEFGHSFAGLADEYYYDDQYEQYYHPGVEPWEQNITTLTDFAAKWQDLLPAKTKIPTAPDAKKMERIGVYEGAGYQSKGVYRAYQDCRMKTNTAAAFCPVCQRAISRLIEYYVPSAENGKQPRKN